MNVTYQHVKKALYVLQSLLGVICLTVSFHFWTVAAMAMAPILYVLPALVLTFVGVGCIGFGIETFLLRDDPDIWR